MPRQLFVLLLFLLGVCTPARAEPLAPIERALDGLAWGMDQAEVSEHLNRKVSAADKDEPLLRNEAPLRRDERVLKGRDAFSRAFYFFRAGRLWKIFVVYEPLVFPEGNFVAFASTLERRLGRAEPMRGERRRGVQRRWLEWRQGRTRLRALDETQHLGCYALVYEQTSNGRERRARTP